MNINEVYQLMDKFEGSTLSELSLEMEGVKLSVKKGCAGAQPTTSFAATAEAVSGAIITQSVNTVQAQSSTPATTVPAAKTINAPLVGTFYRAPSPGENPFVEVGQQVKKGDVVGIIEAMKLMNEITATEDGVVKEIVVADGSLVEYNEVLIRLN